MLELIQSDTFRKWLDGLRNPRSRSYLEAALEQGEDGAAFIAHALGVLARAHGMVQLTEETGLSREDLFKALSARGNPDLGTILKVTKALGLRLVPQTA